MLGAGIITKCAHNFCFSFYFNLGKDILNSKIVMFPYTKLESLYKIYLWRQFKKGEEDVVKLM